MDQEIPSPIQRVFDQLEQSANLYRDAINGSLETPQSVEFHFTGQDEAQALGRAYSMRDKLQEHGYEVETESLGLADEQHECFDGDRYVVRLDISSSED